MLNIYIPKLEDLWFRKQLLEDKETMSYNDKWGGTIPFPKELWQDYYNNWINKDPRNRFYCYLENDDKFVGEMAYHYDEDLKGIIISIIIYSKERHKGYGKEAIDLICKVAKENRISTLYDDIAFDNKAINLFLKKGFTIIGKTNESIIIKKEL